MMMTGRNPGSDADFTEEFKVGESVIHVRARLQYVPQSLKGWSVDEM